MADNDDIIVPVEEDFEVMLTTIDNPYDPFTDFDDWFAFDCENGYYSCSKLARYANIGDDFSDKEEEIEKERAIDEIIKFDVTNNYKKVKRTIHAV